MPPRREVVSKPPSQPIADPFAHALGWFRTKGFTPLLFQLDAWVAYRAGKSGLVHAATGTGKTLAVWMGPVIEYLAEHPDPALWNPKQAAPLRVVWVTPLRALAADTLTSLAAPAEALGLPWTLQTRTSDTKSSVRAKQKQQLPTAMVTTPESLTLLLSYPNASERFADLRCVVVDEWHELLAGKRGVQTELALARLRGWVPGLRTWGLSATLVNVELALRVLVGHPDPPAVLIRGMTPKAVTIDALLPARVERFPWAGHLGMQMLPQVVETVAAGRTALVFTNTRAQTEHWYQAILKARPDWAGVIALHHGSLAKKVRDYVEDGLRTGALRCVVCTSSLDLGVDFSPVDQVVQIGSPKGVARLVQRAGRSGHRPGAESRVTCVPTNALELVEIAAARDAVAAGQIEGRFPLHKPLDVLAQHLVTVAAGGGFDANHLRDEVRTTHAYADLTDAEFLWVLDFVVTGGTLHAYPDFRRVVMGDDGLFRVESPQLAARHRLSVGTIVGEGALTVRYLRGGVLGTVDEGFVSRLRPGDVFQFAGKFIALVRVHEMTAWVRKASTTKGVVPRWAGSRLALSNELAEAVRSKLTEARNGVYVGPEMLAVRPILELQRRWSALPAADELLIERLRTREGFHLFVYPFEGRQVHEGLAALIALRLSRRVPITFTLAVNDYGFELLSPTETPFDAALRDDLLSTDNIAADIADSLNAAELARRSFREIARVAGLVFPGMPGQVKTTKHLQASANLFYQVLAEHDPGNLLLHQARRDVLERQLDEGRLRAALDRLGRAKMILTTPHKPTPLAFPLLIDRLRETLSSEKLADRVRRMQLELERAADR